MDLGLEQINELYREITSVLTSSRDEKNLCTSFIDLAKTLLKPQKLAIYYVYSNRDSGARNSLGKQYTLVDVESNYVLTPDAVEGVSEALGSGHPEKISQELCSNWRIPIRDMNGIRFIICMDQIAETPLSQRIFEDLLTIFENLLHLISLTERDSMTGLYNRQVFEREFEKIQQRSCDVERRYNDSLIRGSVLALIDIDFFKRINDSYGHLYGDEVLIGLSRELSTKFRHTDYSFRYGGEEFAVILTETVLNASADVFERFRHNIATHLFKQIGGITISVGFTVINDKIPMQQLVERADKALYYCKENGRNQVQSWESLVDLGIIEQHAQAREDSIEIFHKAELST